MSALAVMALGLLGVAYAVWPAWRRPGPQLDAGGVMDGGPDEEEREVRAARAWSRAAGELREEGGVPAGPAT